MGFVVMKTQRKDKISVLCSRCMPGCYQWLNRTYFNWVSFGQNFNRS